MTEIQSINSITSVESCKTKRAYRRGQITKIKTHIDELDEKPLRTVKSSELQGIKQDLSREIDLHNALQGQYETLLSSKVSTQDLAEEEANGEEHKHNHRVLLRGLDKLTVKIQHFQRALILQNELEDLRRITDITTRMFEKTFARFSEKVSTYTEATTELQDDEQIQTLRETLQEAVSNYLVDIATAQAKGKDAATDGSSSVAPLIREQRKFNIELPTFCGKPKEWRAFYNLFSTTLKTQGSYLNDKEKTCLLLKAMQSEEARHIVMVHAQGDHGYEKAIEALIANYGNAAILYPYYVREIMTQDHYTYDRDSLRRIKERFLLTYENMAELKGATLAQFLAALAKEQFDAKLREEWSRHIAHKKDLPTIQEMCEYFKPLEATMAATEGEPTATVKKGNIPPSQSKKQNTKTTGNTTSKNQCPLCKDYHPLARCSVFHSYDVDRRTKVIKDNRRCTNCLSDAHTQSKCPSQFNCRLCQGRHHSLLHKEASSSEATVVTHAFVRAQKDDQKASSVESKQADEESSVKIHNQECQDGTTPRSLSPPQFYFVETAIVNVSHGVRHLPARAALDSGAGVSLMSESLASQLKLPRYPQHVLVEGAYGGCSSKHYVQAELRSMFDPTKSATLKFSVVPKLKAALPPRNKESVLEEASIKDLQLADPDLGGPLDLILSSYDRYKFDTRKFRNIPEATLMAIETIFGWTLTGALSNQSTTATILQTQSREDPLQKSLERLWELDQVPDSSALSPTNTQVVQHFHDTHQVQRDGRYMVQLPRISNSPTIGESRNRAITRYKQNESSLNRKGKLHAFENVLREYIELDHAEVIPSKDRLKADSYYLPVHGVFKESSTTTKVRAVFDASAKSSSGTSLNDTLEAGPNLYPLLPDVLIRFRFHKIGLSADISKMFREILLHPDERDLHRFLLRDQDGKLQDCRMKRLTFGIKSSPYLATQVIRHLAESNITTHPEAAKAILENFYVDDFLSGADTVKEADFLRKQLCNLLLQAGMTLRKWRTSSAELRSLIPGELTETKDLILTTPDTVPKALGVHWDVIKDTLHISTPVVESTDSVTKRTIASHTAKVFDVLGLFAPALLPARTLLQSLWKLPLKWDDKVPDDILNKWNEWISTLPTITRHSIPRKINENNSPAVFKTLHGFSDASSKAYGAAVYVRFLHEDKTVSVSLITAKARVLPIKAVTIPRAELVAAHLLSKLIIHVSQTLQISRDKIFAWTDSMIVLCWLQKSPSSLKTFVANRVSAIQELLPSSHWRHVPTDQNPADLLSRGMEAEQLIRSSLWWNGPRWLALTLQDWPTNQQFKRQNLPEIKVVCNAIQAYETSESFWGLYSSFHVLTRIVAWIRRFAHNCNCSPGKHLNSECLDSKEVQDAKLHLLKLSQRQSYDEVFEALRHQRSLSKGHSLARMDVSLDSDKLLKIRCRVRDPNSPREPKKLIPLSLKSEVTRLPVTTLHKSYAHPGVAALLSIIGDTYLIPGLRNFLKKISRNCPTCQRAYARPLGQQLGLLPISRTTPSPPFHRTGIDFAGPFHIRKGHTRKPVIVKSYACLFVCLTTRAVHIELCSELSTPEFMAALKRFTARRGTPADVYSDNGTNFQGAQREIKELQQLQLSQSTKRAISHLCTSSTIHWHFSPPRSPHFGGLWEAGIRSMKTLLRKLVAPHHLRFDELYTVLTEVEAILNSRPLIPLNSTNVDSLTLTPGHFLIGRPLKSPPSDAYKTGNISNLKRWTLVNRLSQDLWKDWLGCYLQSLHHGTKWTLPVDNLQEDDLVFIKDETLRYRDWPLAKVLKVYPGDDGRVRTADVLCHGKCYRRAIHRFIPLYTEDSNPPNKSTSSSPPEDVQDSTNPEQLRMPEEK